MTRAITTRVEDFDRKAGCLDLMDVAPGSTVTVANLTPLADGRLCVSLEIDRVPAVFAVEVDPDLGLALIEEIR